MKTKPWLLGGLAALATGLPHFAAFPPLDVAEAAYVFALPLLLWTLFQPARRTLFLCTLGGFWLSWLMLIVWLRYVHPPMGSVGLVILSFLLALFPAGWVLLVRWLLPPILNRQLGRRLLVLLGLAGAWVILEWVKTWMLSGFPWLPLAASQWLRPAMLQTAEYGGQYAVSFILIFFNLSLAAYGHRLFIGPMRAKAHAGRDAGEANLKSLESPEPHATTSRPRVQLNWRFCPEFYIALAMVFLSVWLYVRVIAGAGERQPMLNVGAVQPWIPAELKWSEAMREESLRVLRQETERVAAGSPKPDLILWPEAAPPYALVNKQGNRGMELWVMEGVTKTNTPIITGALGHFPDDSWVNGMFLLTPENGLHPDFYAKRQLVPFGEYIPWRDALFFITTVVPLDIDLRPGDHSRPLPVPVGEEIWEAGCLVCYEDIFASLGREIARAGADFIVVVTNDGWYGEEAGAYQHAAHSTLRAVETRRPVVRCGNHGWSGWIDEYGNVRDVLTGPDGSIYDRQSKTFALSYDPAFRGKLTFYARYGNWILWLGLLCLIGAGALQRRDSRQLNA